VQRKENSLEFPRVFAGDSRNFCHQRRLPEKNLLFSHCGLCARLGDEALCQHHDAQPSHREIDCVAGGGRMYFRKAVLACCEREWRHVEYEYPAEVQRGFLAQVERLSRTFDRAFTELCDETIGRQN
jgi:hypothetical protein